MPTTLSIPSLHDLPPMPQGWRVLRLGINSYGRDQIVSKRAVRLAEAIEGAGCSRWEAPVALVRVVLLRQGMSPADIDDWIVSAVIKSDRVISWRGR